MKQQKPHILDRNDSGMVLGVAIVGLFLFAIAGTAIALVIAAHTKALINRDADTEAANALSSAGNVIGALVANASPDEACKDLHTDYTDPNNPIRPSTCPTAATDWTNWMPLPGRSGCSSDELEGCWRVRFAEVAQDIQVPGRVSPVSLPVWTATVQAAARCHILPDMNNPPAEVCKTVTDEAVFTYETNALPVYPTLLYSGRFWPEGTIPPGIVCTDGEMPPSEQAQDVWCGIPAKARPAADAQASISAAQVASAGFFINDLPDLTCVSDYCEIAPTNPVNQETARTLEGLPTADLADRACSANPVVVDWALPSGITPHNDSTLPADMPVITPGMVAATGNVTITDNINAPADNPLLIVSGCHIVIDGPCAFGAINPGDLESAPQACDGSVLDQTVYDLNSKRRSPVTLTNVLLIAAGGLWASDLQPSPDACPIPDDPLTTIIDESTPGYQPPALTILGSVITGHAGATSRLRDCDTLPGTEKIVAGYSRTSELPADPSAWVEADIAWWPSREQGSVWRKQGVAPVITQEPDLIVIPASLNVTEGSPEPGQFRVRLATQPSDGDTVTVNATQTFNANVSVIPSSLVFDDTDWATSQYVTVNAFVYQDADTIDTAFQVELTARSTNGSYDSVAAEVDVTITDDDIPSFVLAPASPLSVDENGTASFDVSLATAPSAPVTVTVASDNLNAATATPTMLTFTSSNYKTPQTVTVTGVDDADFDDDATVVTIAASNGGYDNLTAQIAVIITDDDELPFTAAEAESYVEARDCLVHEMRLVTTHGTISYENLYRTNVDWCSDDHLTSRGLSALNPLIPLGQGNPNSLSDPSTSQGRDDLKDDIDVLAIAAGLYQFQIDAAES